MKIYNVEMLDHYIKLQEITNDHRIRAVLNFDRRLDVGKLKELIIQSIQFVPLLSCRYELLKNHPVWVEKPFNVEDVFFIFVFILLFSKTQ